MPDYLIICTHGDEVLTDENAQGNAEPTFLLSNLANGQDEWLRRIIRLVLASAKPCTETDVRGAYELFRQEKQLDDRTLPSEPELVLEADDQEADEELALVSLSKVVGVNAIKDGAEIDFNRGLTILFGENGTGKTGYARILKALANSRSADQILGNVHENNAAQTPSAHIEFMLGEVEDQYDWKGEHGEAPFTRMCVFDSPAVNAHVDADLDYVYTPASLTLFNLVNQGIQGVEELLKKDVSDLSGDASSLLNRFDRAASVYPTIETLGAATDLEELKKHAVVPEQSDDKLNELRVTVAALKANTIDQQLAAIKRHQRSIAEALNFARASKQFDVAEYDLALAELNKLRDDSSALKKALFEAADLPSEPDEQWEGFVREGHAYKQHLEEQHVDDDGKCIYCRQKLDASAVDLLAKYNDYLGGKIAEDIEAKLASIQQATDPVVVLRMEETKVALDERKENQHEDDAALQGVADIHTTIVEKLEKQEQVGTLTALGELDEHLTKLTAAAATVAKQREEVEEQLKNSAESLRKKESELRELESKIELKKSWPEIELRVTNAKTATRIEALLAKLPAIRRQVTEASKLASERLVNQNFAKLFAEECEALRAPSLKLEFMGRQGSAQRRKVIAENHKPSKILSEGEQKVLALADFLSEARLNGISAPIVFDDPVSSLDHRRINEVADRVAALAKDHQVVVFTHDILFATNLLARFESEPTRCAYFQITDTSAKGEVTKATGPRWDSLSGLKAKINQTIEAANNESGETQAALVRTGYGWLRSWCEVFVETELLAGVTERYQPNVKMGSLQRIKPSALPGAIAETTKIFDDACRYIDSHSQPLPSLSVSPTLDGLKADWAAAQACRKAYLDA